MYSVYNICIDVYSVCIYICRYVCKYIYIYIIIHVCDAFAYIDILKTFQTWCPASRTYRPGFSSTERFPVHSTVHCAAPWIEPWPFEHLEITELL